MSFVYILSKSLKKRNIEICFRFLGAHWILNHCFLDHFFCCTEFCVAFLDEHGPSDFIDCVF